MKFLIMLVIYILFSTSTIFAQTNIVDHVVAVVNNQVILDSDVNKMIFMLKQDKKSIKLPFNINYFRKKAINKLILDSLMLSQADQKKIFVNNDQVNAAIRNMALQKHMTFEDFKNSNFFNNADFTYQDYFESVQKHLRMAILERSEILNHIHISKNSVNVLFNKLIKHNNDNNKIVLSYIFLPFKISDTQEIYNNKKILSHNIIKYVHRYNNFMSVYHECMKHKNFFLVKTIAGIHFKEIQKKFATSLNIIKAGDVIGPIYEKNGIYILKIHNIKNKKSRFIKDFHIAHCLIKFLPHVNEKLARNKIFEIYNNIKNHIYSFDYAVKNFSNDSYSYNRNGDLGWISSKFLDKNFKKLLIHLKNNEVGYPIKSSSGWHIIKLLQNRFVDQYYTIVKNKAYNILFNKKILIERKKWIDNLNKLSYINIIEK